MCIYIGKEELKPSFKVYNKKVSKLINDIIEKN